MGNAYYETIDKMENEGVDPEYINGWAGGWLHNPKREEQQGKYRRVAFTNPPDNNAPVIFAVDLGPGPRKIID